jgi:hypothetical protein
MLKFYVNEIINQFIPLTDVQRGEKEILKRLRNWNKISAGEFFFWPNILGQLPTETGS